MPNTTNLPNMGLIVPTVGQDPGPDWANNVNADLGILDQHNHTSGQGVPITPAAININTDLTMNNNNLTHVNTVNFTAHVASLPGSAPNLGCIYVAGNELVYNDEAGNVVPITKTGSVNAGAGSITGLPSGTASASYNSGSKTFVWQSATSTAANMDGGSYIFREVAASANGITVSSPTSLAAPYGIQWFTSLPGSLKAVTIDASGNLGNALFNANQLTPQTVTQNLLAPRSTGTTVAAGGVAISSVANFTSSALTFTDIGWSSTITTTGRPVMIMFEPIDAAAASQMYINTANTGLASLDTNFQILNNAAAISDMNLFFDNFVTGATPQLTMMPGGFNFLDMSVNGSAGTYTYTAQVKCNTAPMNFIVTKIKMVVYEI